MLEAIKSLIDLVWRGRILQLEKPIYSRLRLFFFEAETDEAAEDDEEPFVVDAFDGAAPASDDEGTVIITFPRVLVAEPSSVAAEATPVASSLLDVVTVLAASDPPLMA